MSPMWRANWPRAVGSFNTTVGSVRALEPRAAQPQRWPELAPDHPAVLCYIDWEIAKAPSPCPNGEISKAFDRAVVAIVDGRSELIIAGYSRSQPPDRSREEVPRADLDVSAKGVSTQLDESPGRVEMLRPSRLGRRRQTSLGRGPGGVLVEGRNGRLLEGRARAPWVSKGGVGPDTPTSARRAAGPCRGAPRDTPRRPRAQGRSPPSSARSRRRSRRPGSGAGPDPRASRAGCRRPARREANAPGTRYVADLFSGAALRIVRRLLIETDRSWTLADMATATGLTQGFVSRTFKTLARDAYLDRARGASRVVDRDALLSAWAAAPAPKDAALERVERSVEHAWQTGRRPEPQ